MVEEPGYPVRTVEPRLAARSHPVQGERGYDAPDDIRACMAYAAEMPRERIVISDRGIAWTLSLNRTRVSALSADPLR